MLKYILIIVLWALPYHAFSKPLNSSKMADLVFNLIQDRMFHEPGMNGIDVTGCDPKTGKKIDMGLDFIHCIRIYGISDKAVKNLLSIYPEGTSIRGVPVIIEKAQWQIGG